MLSCHLSSETPKFTVSVCEFTSNIGARQKKVIKKKSSGLEILWWRCVKEKKKKLNAFLVKWTNQRFVQNTGLEKGRGIFAKSARNQELKKHSPGAFLGPAATVLRKQCFPHTLF